MAFWFMSWLSGFLAFIVDLSQTYVTLQNGVFYICFGVRKALSPPLLHLHDHSSLFKIQSSKIQGLFYCLLSNDYRFKY
jgi:hypothetical protein